MPLGEGPVSPCDKKNTVGGVPEKIPWVIGARSVTPQVQARGTAGEGSCIHLEVAAGPTKARSTGQFVVNILAEGSCGHGHPTTLKIWPPARLGPALPPMLLPVWLKKKRKKKALLKI